jgi:hypothetical protein
MDICTCIVCICFMFLFAGSHENNGIAQLVTLDSLVHEDIYVCDDYSDLNCVLDECAMVSWH